MFNDIKKGFSFNLGRIISKLFIFFLILFLLFCFNAVRSKALVVDGGPTSIYSHYGSSEEYYNVYSNGIFYEPRDSGNVLPYFDDTPKQLQFTIGTDGNWLDHYHATDFIDFTYDASNINRDITLTYNVYYYGYQFAPYVSGTNLGFRFNLVTTEDFVLDELIPSSYNNPRNVDYVSDGSLLSATPIFRGSSYIGNGGWSFMFSVNLKKPTGTIYIKSQPVVGSQNVALTTGLKIVQIQNWNGEVNFGDLINNNNNNTNQIISSQNNGFSRIVNAILSVPSNILNGISSLPGLIWSAFSGGFNTLTGALNNIFNSIKDIMSNDQPTSEFLSDWFDNFLHEHDNIILTFISLPIQFLQRVIDDRNCVPINLGSLYGYDLIIPCVGGVIHNLLGNNLYTTISVIVCAYIYWRYCFFLYDVIEKVLSLETDLNQKFSIYL